MMEFVREITTITTNVAAAAATETASTFGAIIKRVATATNFQWEIHEQQWKHISLAPVHIAATE